jgi:hypothetical protein
MNAPARAADVVDLLGIPWERQDCAELAQRALAACGIPVPAHALARFDRNDAHGLQAFLKGLGGRWIDIGFMPADARKLGDVIVTRYAEGLMHLAVLVDEERRLALTTSSRSRSACVRVDRMTATWKVIRWEP